MTNRVTALVEQAQRARSINARYTALASALKALDREWSKPAKSRKRR